MRVFGLLVAFAACGSYETSTTARPPETPDHVELAARAIAIAAHNDLACALLETGKVSCWGAERMDYYREQPGHLPQLVPNVDEVVELSASCGRTRAGGVRCWNPAPAVFQPLPHNITRVAANDSHSCMIVDGTVYCAGNLGGYRYGEVERSIGRPAPRIEPRGARIVGIENATAVAVGGGSDCAIVDGGEIACWGAFINTSPFLPAVRVPGVRDAIDISTDWEHGCAVRKTGDVVCWGDANSDDVPVDMKQAVVPHPIAIHDAKRVVVGFGHACALRNTGELTCWGESFRGARGTGRLDDSARGCANEIIGEHWWGHRCFGDPASDRVPTTVAGITDAIDVAAGMGFSCALRANGEVTCWGINDRKQLGIETPTAHGQLVDVIGLDHVRQLAAGHNHTCALRDNGDVTCWGASPRGEIGRAETSATPVRVVGDATQVVVSGYTSCALLHGGSVKCWGKDPVTFPTEAATQIALGPFGLCALTKSGVQCNGQLVPGTTSATQVVSGRDFACALVGHDGVCWGPGFKLVTKYNPNGNTDPHIATRVPTTELAACGGQLCIATPNGPICGRDTFGITVVDDYPLACNAPWQRVIEDKQVKHIVYGHAHRCALMLDGHVMCRGANDFGQLGTGTMGLVAAPVFVRTI